MANDTSTNPSNRKLSAPVWSTIFNVQIVLLVAILLATFFTAWTPDGPGFVAGDINPVDPQNPISINPTVDSNPDTAAVPVENTPAQVQAPIIGIVVGHWGDQNDHGAVCADGLLTELDVNQAVASMVEKALVTKGYQVTLLKEFDDQLAGFGALALISIHADSCDYYNDLATGYKVAAAMGKQNQDRSTRLAACLRSRYGLSTGLPLHSMSITPDMTSYHAFGEISADTPAAIIETGFLNLDRQFLTENPDLAAKGIVDGLLCYLNNESISPNPLQPTP